MSLRNDMDDREKVLCWLGHRQMGIEQNDLAVLYGVNIGRVNEAIKAIDYVVGHTKEVYNMARANQKDVTDE